MTRCEPLRPSALSRFKRLATTTPAQKSSPNPVSNVHVAFPRQRGPFLTRATSAKVRLSVGLAPKPKNDARGIARQDVTRHLALRPPEAMRSSFRTPPARSKRPCARRRDRPGTLDGNCGSAPAFDARTGFSISVSPSACFNRLTTSAGSRLSLDTMRERQFQTGRQPAGTGAREGSISALPLWRHNPAPPLPAGHAFIPGFDP